MNQTKPIDTKVLIEKAKTSKDKEAYKLLEKTTSYRIGVGARVDKPDLSSFFIEIVFNLSTENGEVNLLRLEKTLRLLKTLKAKGYSLTYQGDNSISCETTTSIDELSHEYVAAKAMVK